MEHDHSARAIRAKLLDGHVTVDDFAQGIGSKRGTVLRYARIGMPSMKLGKSVMVPVDPALDWIRGGGFLRKNLG